MRVTCASTRTVLFPVQTEFDLARRFEQCIVWKPPRLASQCEGLVGYAHALWWLRFYWASTRKDDLNEGNEA